jgi:hypothetical protein
MGTARVMALKEAFHRRCVCSVLCKPAELEQCEHSIGHSRARALAYAMAKREASGVQTHLSQLGKPGIGIGCSCTFMTWYELSPVLVSVETGAFYFRWSLASLFATERDGNAGAMSSPRHSDRTTRPDPF